MTTETTDEQVIQDQSDETKFVGEIRHVIFQKDDFCLLSVYRHDLKEIIVCKGNLLNPKKGAELEFAGKIVDYQNKKTGKNEKQMAFHYAFAPMPKNGKEIFNYLKDITGEKTAELIIEKYSEENVLDILDNEPDRLLSISGIGRIRLKKIVEKHQNLLGNREVFVFFKQFDLKPNTIQKIIEGFGAKQAVQKFRENPYILTHLSGFGFKRADEIARKTGIDVGDDRRIQASALFLLEEATNNGHCYLPLGHLARQMEDTLQVTGHQLISNIQVLGVIKEMIAQNQLIVHNAENEEQIYLPWLYAIEQSVARQILRFNSTPRAISIDVDKEIEAIEKEFGHAYANQQREFLHKALVNNFIILTGGPGTGKTTVLNGLMKLLEKAFPADTICLCAPTGKAAKRMKESTGREASTMHRILGVERGGKFKHNEFNPLEVEITDVDEFSMVDIFMANSFFKALRPNTKVILVGDVDQLPSVGAGAVLLDMLNSGVVPYVRLTEIFRQAQDSGIVVNAYRVNNGEFPNAHAPKNDFVYIPVQDSDECVQKIEEIMMQYSWMYDPKDIQVLTPTKERTTGVKNLNERLQYLMNEKFDQKEYKVSFSRDESVTFRIGDKVMQYKNNYDLNVFNGDSGTVVDIVEERDEDGDKITIIKVEVDNEIVEYTPNDLKDLRHSFAVTIHKSQGSEWPVVIIPVTNDAHVMLKRNLLYTAITRAKKACIVVGVNRAVGKCIKTLDMSTRFTNLDLWLRTLSA